MFNKSENPQVIYSLDALSDALFKLMCQKKIKDISVTEICNEAGVSRKTFYRNCEDKMDLIHYKILFYVKKQYMLFDTTIDAHIIYTIFLKYWYKHKNFLKLIYKHGLFPMFERYYIDYSENALDYCMLSDYLSNRKNVDKIRAFHNALMVGGTCNLIKYWTKESFETPIEDLVELICTFRP